MTCWKAHDPHCLFRLSAADRTNNNVADMAALVSAFESAPRFKGADKSSAQTTISINLVALSCRIFSLGHVLVDYAFGAAIRIAYGDRDGGDEDGRDGACRVA